MKSPHLPPDSCNIGTHYKLQSLWKVLFVVFIGFLSGITAAFVAVAWVLPEWGTINTVPMYDRSNRANAAEVPDPLLTQQLRQRTVSVYDKRKKVAKTYYSDASFIGDALLVSSDGWAMLPDPDGTAPDASFWEGLDYQGVSHGVKKTVRDQTRHRIYVQFSGEGFRIMSFAPFDAIVPGTNLWAVSGGIWKRASIDTVVPKKDGASHLVSQLQPSMSILPVVPKKSILLTNEGALFGFVDADGSVVPSWLLDYELSAILRDGSVAYKTVLWRGNFVTRRTSATAAEEVSGFYVESGAGKTTTGVQNGDVVIRFNNKSVDPLRITYDLLSAPAEFSATVIRNEKEVEVKVKK